MATTNTPATLASRLKEVYPDGPTVLVPAVNELHGKRLKFRKDIQLGQQARFDIQLSVSRILRLVKAKSPLTARRRRTPKSASLMPTR